MNQQDRMAYVQALVDERIKLMIATEAIILRHTKPEVEIDQYPTKVDFTKIQHLVDMLLTNEDVT